MTPPSSAGGFSQPLANDPVNLFANAREISLNIGIAHAQDHKAICLQRPCTHFILCSLRRLKMPAAVQFNGKLCLGAIEIHDKIAYGLLPLESDWVSSEKIIP